MENLKTILFITLIGLILGSRLSFADPWSPLDALNPEKTGLAAEFVNIPAGTFMQGSPVSEWGRPTGSQIDPETLHEVRITQSFEIQRTPVTQLQYVLIMKKNPALFRSCDSPLGGADTLYGHRICKNHPVEQVSWNCAQLFVHNLNAIQEEYDYRLPTEAEWEYAAHGGKPEDWLYSFDHRDQEALDAHAWHYGNRVKNDGPMTKPVAQKLPNPFGLFDIHGLVNEWVQDYFGVYPSTPQDNPKGPDSGVLRVFRGGSVFSDPEELRSAARGAELPKIKSEEIGFRLVRTLRAQSPLSHSNSFSDEGLDDLLETRFRPILSIPSPVGSSVDRRSVRWSPDLESISYFERESPVCYSSVDGKSG